jgi:hypothetical protein
MTMVRGEPLIIETPGQSPAVIALFAKGYMESIDSIKRPSFTPSTLQPPVETVRPNPFSEPQKTISHTNDRHFAGRNLLLIGRCNVYAIEVMFPTALEELTINKTFGFIDLKS